MDETVDFERVLCTLYDAALDTRALPLAVERMTTWLDGDTCHLFALSKRTGTPVLSVSYGLDGGVGPSYAAHYAGIDPRRELAMRLPAGEFISCHEHFTARAVSRSEFFQDYLLPLGVHYLLGSGELIQSDETTVQIGFQRYVGQVPFDATAQSRMRRLMPHLERAMALLVRSESLRAALVTAEQGMNALDWGMIALDAEGHVVFANSRAELLLRAADCVVVTGHRLGANHFASDKQLTAALRRVVATGAPESLMLEAAQRKIEHAGEQSHDSSRQYLTISRLSNAEAETGSAMRSIFPGARLLVFISTPKQQRTATCRQLMQLFGLTPAEARLAHGLLRGLSAGEYKQEQGVSHATVRTQIRSILAKTGTRRQAELLGLLSRMPSARPL